MKSAAPITPDQIRMIHTLARNLFIEEDLRRQMMAERFGVDTCKGLNRIEASMFIDELIRKSGREPKPAGRKNMRRRGGERARRALPANVIELATVRQLEKIDALRVLVDWRFDDGFERWLKARMRIDRVRTNHDAQKTIEGLKEMIKNQFKATHGHRWKSLDWDSRPEVQIFIWEHCLEQ